MRARREPMRRPRRGPGPRGRLAGNAAIEFALLLPLFLYILYGLVSFSMMFAAQHLMTLAAAEGARASLQYQRADDLDAALALRRERACATAVAFVDWLQQRTDGSVSCEAASMPCAHDAALICLQVTLSYPYRAAPLLPAVPLGEGLMPVQMRGDATVQLNPMSLADAAGATGRRLAGTVARRAGA